jgi:lysophospholipase L1-like esterase
MNTMFAVVSRRSLLAWMAGLVSLLAFPLHAEDERPVVDDKSVAKETAAKAALPTLWIAGDSTVRSNQPMRGWGQDLGMFFDAAKINVVNRAIGGRSSRTYFTEGKWRDIENGLKPGDFVLIQFGHNDVGPTDERSKFRGSVKGIGEETETVKKPDGSTEEVRSYGWYLKTMARSAKAKGAKVILCTPVPHKKFDREGKFVQDWAGWREWVKACALAEEVGFLDLAEGIGQRYAKLPPAEVEGFFADKGTHTNAAGSLFNAKAVVAGLRAMEGAPLDGFLNENGRQISAAGD